jgi:hypothetical protein
VPAGHAQTPAPEQTWPVGHGVAVWVGQVPLPLQLAADRAVVEFWQVAAAHAVELPGKVQAELVPLHEPAQTPVPPQGVLGVVTLLQVPGVAEHDWHWPVHGPSQHTPSTQFPLVH